MGFNSGFKGLNQDACDSNFYSQSGAAISVPVPPNSPVQQRYVFSSSASTNLNNQDK